MGKKDKKHRQPVPSLSDFIKFLLMLTGLILMVFVVVLFRKTIITPGIPVGVTLVTAFIAYILIKKDTGTASFYRCYVLPFLSALLSWGFIACYAFMAVNYYAAEGDVQHYTFKIEERGSLVGPRRQRERRTPTVTINYFGYNKELVFPYDATQKVNSSQNVRLIVRRGYFGYDIIERKEVY